MEEVGEKTHAQKKASLDLIHFFVVSQVKRQKKVG